MMLRNIRTKKIIILFVLVFVAAAFLLWHRASGNRIPPLARQAYENYNLPLATLSITGSDEDFWGYNEGILVPGRLWDEYKKEQIDKGVWTPEEAEQTEPTELMDANFNHKEWVKICEVALSDAGGRLIFSDRVGLRISGNASRKLCRKSFVITSGSDFGSKGSRFYVNLGNENINSYNKLRIHTGGQDLRETQLRDELIAKMAARAGISPVRETMPIMVYINNEFYGIGHLENRLDEDYLSSYYDLPKDKIELVSGGIADIQQKLGYTMNAACDFSDENLRADLESKIDFENFMKYWVFNMVTANADWPHNNVVMWRYTGDAIEGVAESDGRYRFLLSDVDVTFMADEKSDPFDELNWGETGEAYQFMEAVLEYQPYRDYFVNLITDQITECFDEDFVAASLTNIQLGYGDAFRYALVASDEPVLTGYLLEHDNNTQELYRRIVERKGRLFDYLYQYYDSGEGYVLQVKAPQEGEINLSSIRINAQDKQTKSQTESQTESTTGHQTAELTQPLTITSIRSAGCDTQLAYVCNEAKNTAAENMPMWYVNGIKYSSANQPLMVSAANADGGRVCVEIK